MRIFLTILLCLITTELAHSAMNPLIGCLGQEELRLHKAKRTGPVYKLNQIFLNDMVSAGDITLKKKYFEKVCVHPTFTPSIDLMREILMEGQKIFKLTSGVTNASIRNFQLSTIKEVKRVIPHIFFSYISDLQSRTATPDCLGKYIPELKYFQTQFKYLENELGSERLMQNKAKISKIFSALKKFPEIRKKCLEDKKKRMKAKS